jgi:acetyl esterase/lipase
VVGVSARANIAHNMAITAGVSELPAPARIEGVILLHPSFASEDKMEAEDEEFCRANKMRWAAIFPGAKDGLHDPRINPMADGAPSLAKLAGERLLVCTTSGDPRALRGRAYYDAVRASGWKGGVDWFESNGEGHGFIPNPVCREAVRLMERVVAFVAGH